MQTQNMTLMFVDIPTIGTIREQKGEEAAREYQQRCLALLGEVRKHFAGNLVRSIGGTLLCSFTDAGDAVEAAVRMQEAMVSSGLTEGGVQVRMGLHAGTVHVRAGNYSGEAVTMAARTVTLAKPGAIVATGAVFEQAGERAVRRFAAMKGQAVERLNLELYEVSWRPGGEADTDAAPLASDAVGSKRKTAPTRLRPLAAAGGVPVRRVALREVPVSEDAAPSVSPAAGDVPAAAEGVAPSAAPATSQPAGTPPAPSGNTLRLIWREKVLVVNRTTAVSMGRDNVNDIVLLVSTASRRHAEVCCRDGVFLVIDRSANGTFVYDDQGKEHYVHQAELALTESGAICPGCPQEEPGCEALLYWIAE